MPLPPETIAKPLVRAQRGGAAGDGNSQLHRICAGIGVADRNRAAGERQRLIFQRGLPGEWNRVHRRTIAAHRRDGNLECLNQRRIVPAIERSTVIVQLHAHRRGAISTGSGRVSERSSSRIDAWLSAGGEQSRIVVRNDKVQCLARFVRRSRSDIGCPARNGLCAGRVQNRLAGAAHERRRLIHEVDRLCRRGSGGAEWGSSCRIGGMSDVKRAAAYSLGLVPRAERDRGIAIEIGIGNEADSRVGIGGQRQCRGSGNGREVLPTAAAIDS